MSTEQVIDHLFRHQFGKMVSILTRIFGLQHLESIEDAIQDTFVKATVAWRNGIPDNPEAWLTQAAKNRTIDLFRKLRSENTHTKHFESGPATLVLSDLFLDDEIDDAQLRMIFTACHPALDPRDQIAFALKTIAGFSQKEIAAALLLKEETIKKRLSRARRSIKEKNVQFVVPQGKELSERRERVLEVLYLIFNEGFHSTQKDRIVRKELCGEAMRLISMLRDSSQVCTAEVHALFALMCFLSARLDSKVGADDLLIDLKKQDRSLWHFPLVRLGNAAMLEAVQTETFSAYHFESAIAAEHLKAGSFEHTNWNEILKWYGMLEAIEPSVFNQLNMAVVNLQLNDTSAAEKILEAIDVDSLEQRAYLYYGCMGQLYLHQEKHVEAISQYDKAISLVRNSAEKDYLIKKRAEICYGLL